MTRNSSKTLTWLIKLAFFSLLPASIKTVYRVQNYRRLRHFYYQIRIFKISWLYYMTCTHSWSSDKTFSRFNDNRAQKLLTPPLEYLPLLLIKNVCIIANHSKDHFRAWISSNGRKMIYVIKILKKRIAILNVINICMVEKLARSNLFYVISFIISLSSSRTLLISRSNNRLYANFW